MVRDILTGLLISKIYDLKKSTARLSKLEVHHRDTENTEVAQRLVIVAKDASVDPILQDYNVEVHKQSYSPSAQSKVG
jgi:hypothetical protein